jgi:signal transduction histidine kinase
VDAHQLESRATPILRRKNLGAFAASAVQRMTPLSETAGITLKIALPDKPVWGWGQAASIDQILDNLLSNAIRYSHPGGVVTVRVVDDQNSPTIEIRDQGIGIPPGERPMLFKKFQRGAATPLNGPRGSGLGLYIVDVLTKSIHAHCRYEPNPLGGSIFLVSFTPAPSADSRPPSRGMIAAAGSA